MAHDQRHAFAEPLEPRRLFAAVVPVAPLILPELYDTIAAPRTIASADGKVFFAYSNTSGSRSEIWRYDPSAGTASQLVDDTGIAGLIGNVTPLGSRVLFTTLSSDGTTYNFYGVDATPNLQSLEPLITTSTSLSVPQYVLFNGLGYFARNYSGDAALYRTNGTQAGTAIAHAGSAWNLAASPTALFFTNNGLAKIGTNGAYTSLWTGSTRDDLPGPNLAVVGTRAFFVATPAGSNTRWLYVNDGTTTGTVPLVALDLTDSSTQSPNLTVVGNVLYFTAQDGTNTPALWKSDGTVAGTVVVRDLNTKGTWPSSLTAVAGRLYFAAYDGTHGIEPWYSDGTTAGTSMLADVAAGADSSNPTAFAAAGANVLFGAADRAHGFEPWTTDGTVAGTHLAADTWPGEGGSAPRDLLAGPDGLAYYTATDPATGFVLMRSDGTPGGTRVAFDPTPGPYNPIWLRSVVSANGTEMFFTAGDGSYAGRELWRSDGTPAGTGLLKDINGTTTPLASTPTLLKDVNGTLYFAATTSANGNELWKSDGTPAGTSLVADIIKGGRSSNPNQFVDRNGTLYFYATAATTAQTGTWTTDGTAAGTTFLNTSFPVADPVKVLLNGVNYAASGNALLRYSPNGTSTTVVTLSTNSSTSYLGIRNLTSAGGKLYFEFDDGSTHGDEPWVSDGTSNGTLLLKDVNVHPGSFNDSKPYGFLSIGGHVLFAAASNYPYDPAQIWVTDGTPASTHLLGDATGVSPSATFWTQLGPYILFLGRTATTGYELYRTDGTAAGTTLVRDIAPGPTSSTPQSPNLFGGHLYFTADDGTTGRELWVTDGTPAGTYRVTDLNPGPASSLPANFTTLGGSLYFTATDGTQPWLFSITNSAGLTTTAHVTLTGPAAAPLLTLDGGLTTVTTDLGSTWPGLRLDVRNGGSVTFSTPQRFSALTITAGSSVTLAAGSQNTLNDLQIDPASTLDLADASLLLDYATTSPLPTIRQYLHDHLLTSSVAATTPNHSIGYAESSDLGPEAASLLAGGPTDPTALLLIKYTLTGDANLDGKLNADDFALLDRGRAKGLTTWTFGDFNYDAQVTDADAALLNTAFAPPPPTPAPIAPVITATPAVIAAPAVTATPVTTPTKKKVAPKPTPVKKKPKPAPAPPRKLPARAIHTIMSAYLRLLR